MYGTVVLQVLFWDLPRQMFNRERMDRLGHAFAFRLALKLRGGCGTQFAKLEHTDAVRTVQYSNSTV